MTDHAPRPWRVWDLDAEMRYQPVLEFLPAPDGRPLVEVGPGGVGIAGWTDAEVLGVDPGGYGDSGPENLTRIVASGDAIPLADASARAAVAVDTFEHIPPALRPAVVADMVRVTAPGGRVLINGPAGPVAASADRWLLRALDRRGTISQDGSVRWLREHLENGLPDEADFRSWLALPRVAHVNVRRVFPVPAWRLMHMAGIGMLPRTGPLHGVVWSPVAAVARHVRRGPCYRLLVVATVA